MSKAQQFIFLVISVVLAVMLSMFPFSEAGANESAQLEQQIKQLEGENAHSHDKVDALQIYASDIKDAINKLQASINDLQAKIESNKSKREQLRKEIVEAEIELEEQRAVLGENIRKMYVEGEISTLEMLATSKDLSQFVDKQQYRSVVSDKIKQQLDLIEALKAKLADQKKQVEQTIKEDEEAREEISAQKAEKDRLLAMNQAQQAEFNSKIAENNKKIDELEEAKAALARRIAAGSFVSQGAVKAGDRLGNVGNTGYSTGAHLHLEARYANGSTFNALSKIGNGWRSPLNTGYISQHYGNSWNAYDSGSHSGTDYAGATGAPVHAVADGTIISRGCSSDSEFFNYSRAYGFAVVIQHHDGTFSVYGHMAAPSGYGHCSTSYGFN